MRLLLILFIPIIVLALEIIIDPYAEIYDYDEIHYYSYDDCYCPENEKNDYDSILKELAI